MTPRPHIGLAVKLRAALIQLQLDPDTAELDHDPALVLRQRTEDGRYIPDANDPAHLKWRSPDAHSRKTFGPGGEKRITTAGSDIGLAKKIRHVVEDEESFRRRLLAKGNGEPKRRSTWPSRPFPKRPLSRKQRKA